MLPCNQITVLHSNYWTTFEFTSFVKTYYKCKDTTDLQARCYNLVKPRRCLLTLIQNPVILWI